MITLVLGIGRPDGGDAAAGLLVADLLRDTPHLVARAIDAPPDEILAEPRWDQADHVVLVDTVVTGAPPGTVFCWDAAEALDLLDAARSTVLDLGVVVTVRKAARLGRLPRHLTVVGIEGASFEPGLPPRTEVLAAVERVAAALEIQVLLAPVDSARGSLSSA